MKFSGKEIFILDLIIDNGVPITQAEILEKQAAEDRGAGRPPHVPTEQTRGFVLVLRGYRIPVDRISAALNIATSTLYVHYRHELENAETLIDGEVLTAWMRLVKKGDPLTVNRYIEKKFAFSDDNGGVASMLPNVVVIDNIPTEPPAPAVIDAGE